MVGKLIIIYFGKGSNKGGRQYFLRKKMLVIRKIFLTFANVKKVANAKISNSHAFAIGTRSIVYGGFRTTLIKKECSNKE